MAAAPPPRSRPAMTMADNDDGRRAAPFIALHHQPSGHGRPISDPARSQRVQASALSRDSVISHPFSPKISSPPSPSSVVSSAIRHHSRHEESQQTSQHSVTYPPRARLDLEKQNVLPQSPQPRTFISISNPDVVIRTSGQRPNDDTPESDALKILLYLSGPCAIFSFAIMLWTAVALLISVILQPLRFCSYRPTFNEQLCIFLVPPLNQQLRIIRSKARSTQYRSSMLVLVHIFAPCVAVGVAVASWVAASFWFFSAILGDPAGQDGHNDGRATVLGVRTWWERWLVRALSN